MMVKSSSRTIGCREAGWPPLQYRAHLASMTSLGTRSPMTPLVIRRRRVILVSLCWASRSEPRNRARPVRACVISVLSGDISSARSFRRKSPIRCLICVASHLGPANPTENRRSTARTAVVDSQDPYDSGWATVVLDGATPARHHGRGDGGHAAMRSRSSSKRDFSALRLPRPPCCGSCVMPDYAGTWNHLRLYVLFFARH